MENVPQYNSKIRPKLNEDDINFLIKNTIIKSLRELEDENRFLNEMATIGKFTNELVIMVRMNDGGNLPHFHIVDNNSLGDEFHTCVRIDTNKYFHHTGKEDTLNSKQRKKLISFLKQDLGNNWTNWNVLVDLWNRNNSELTIPLNTEMPDYSEIND